jgi:hypothetical protein
MVPVFICVHLWLSGPAFAAPAADQAFDAALKGLDRAKEEVRHLKDAWDKARLEATLYDQRAKRAYQKWAKAGKDLRKKAEEQRERAQWELQLAVERRKLAWNRWQAAQYRMLMEETKVKLLEQERDIRIVEERIGKLEERISRQSAVDGWQPTQSGQ